MADVQVDATDLADRAPVKQAVESNDYSNLETQLAKWQANRRSKIDGLAVYSTDGTMLATAHANRAHIGIAANNTEAILRVANTGRPDRGVALWSKTTGHPIVPILIPVRSATGEVGAVLSATLSLESLTETLLALQLAPNSRVSVIDNTSGLLAATAKGRWRPIRRCPGYRGACFSRNRPPRHSRQSRT